MAKKKTKKNTNKNGLKRKEPKFIIEKDGKAYFKDTVIKMVCKPSKPAVPPKYPGYLFEYEYEEKLKWFKGFVMLMAANGGEIRYVGMTEEEFFALGGEIVEAQEFEEVDASQIRKKLGFFNMK